MLTSSLCYAMLENGGYDLNKEGSDNLTPLQWPGSKNKQKIIIMLLDKHRQVNDGKIECSMEILDVAAMVRRISKPYLVGKEAKVVWG